MRKISRVNIISLMAMTMVNTRRLDEGLTMPQINTPGNMGNINMKHYHPRQPYKGIKQPPRYVGRSGRRLGR